ncbi:peptidoglycan-binding domain-containing protein [Pontivivens ytuae]|uniref:Peptidoglycan-binding protein n=1 Tax=Pontivivens ytuae TaxID=2789856 RepID=A0A7S9LS47_9RHOB|nr:peptidoglycan-binding protein [Pontivivens ytuae]QPH54079.1 peptidoglycan-binding protein [Pontivivens ytuae]
MITRAFALALCLIGMAPVASAQSERILALVVATGDGTARADEVQSHLEVLGTETLRADDPSNAQLRSILTRFAREAADARVSLVYLDLPAVTFEGRAFVLPDGARIERPTDLFTQGIPLLAFARSAAQAEQGGAVLATVRAADNVPAELAPLIEAPEAVPGSSPIVVAEPDAFPNLDVILQDALQNEEVELGALMRRMFTQTGVTLSAFPQTPTILRAPTEPEGPTEVIVLPVIEPEPVAETTETVEIATAPPETLEELSLLEASLSRSAKRSLQRVLRDLGHYKGLVDGIFGPQTRQAIRTFQEERAEEPTGVLSRRQLLDLSS